jgi:hypothetical protein
MSRDIDTIIETIAVAAEWWRAPDSKFRKQAVADAPVTTRFSPPMVELIVDTVFGAYTRENLQKFLEVEIGDRYALDDGRARGPKQILHVLAGNVPAPSIQSIVCGLLLKSQNVAKMSMHDPIFPALFVESLREIDKEIGESVQLFSVRDELPEKIARADAVLAYGNDRTVAEIRKLAPTTAKFIGYGHKISFGVVAGRLAADEEVAAAAAFDASIYDQHGCLSPHVFYVCGPVKPFAANLAAAMEKFQEKWPRGEPPFEENAAFAKLRAGYEFRAANDPRVKVFGGDNFLVIAEDDKRFSVSCLNRVVFVKPARNFGEVVELTRPIADKISTIGVAPLDDESKIFAQTGASRVCAIGKMQTPPLEWHHDGRPNLADLVTWCDFG